MEESYYKKIMEDAEKVFSVIEKNETPENMEKIRKSFECALQKTERIFCVMEKRETPDNLRRIREAFELALKAHEKQRRKTGELYIIHPVAVALIVAEELSLDANSVIAAYLHDVVEDTDYTIDDIESKFGSDVAYIVRTVTKKKTKKYEMSKQLDNYKQMLGSLQHDERAILVKLADRLHNMRTLNSMRPDKQMKIAGETDYFYAPLANRLGFYWIKTELENLSFHFRCPHEYEKMEKLLAEDRANNSNDLNKFVAKINDILKNSGIETRIEVKYRMPYSIWRKMTKLKKDFHHINHRHYIKIIFPYVSGLGMNEKDMCLRIYSYLTDKFQEKPGSVTNYIDNPKENGYQSFHVKLLSDERGTWEEIHICSERMVQDSRLGCMSVRPKDNIKKWIDKFKLSLNDIATHGMLDGYIEDVVKSFYNDDIMVFTPEGEPMMLPKRATALDFAFNVHSEIGLHAKAAYINGKLCSVKAELNRGDCVNIATDYEIEPQPDWLNHVLTYKAKRDISNALSQRAKPKYCRCNECQPIPCEEVIGFENNDGTISIHKRNCPTLIRLASQYGDNIKRIEFHGEPYLAYPTKLHITAIDRKGMLNDIIEAINTLKLFIISINVKSEDYIVDCTIQFKVHSFIELTGIIQKIKEKKGVDEVTRI